MHDDLGARLTEIRLLSEMTGFSHLTFATFPKTRGKSSTRFRKLSGLSIPSTIRLIILRTFLRSTHRVTSAKLVLGAGWKSRRTCRCSRFLPRHGTT
jgi:hypothetical protein